jgi:hypothetical protein
LKWEQIRGLYLSKDEAEVGQLYAPPALTWSHDNSVITETDYGLDGGFSILGREFSLFYRVHTGSGDPPSLLSNGYLVGA